MSAALTLEDLSDAGARRLRVSGRMTVRNINEVARRARAILPDGRPLTVDVSGVERLDTVGAWVLHRLRRDWELAGLEFRLTGCNRPLRTLIDSMADLDKPVQIRPEDRNPLLVIAERAGGAIVRAALVLGHFLTTLGFTLAAFGKAARGRHQLRWAAIVRQFEVVGIDALGIIGLMSFLVGVVVAQQGAVQLATFGAEAFTVNLVGRITFRELGVLMTAIMVAGRSGSAFAAQIGSMKLAEEVDALRTIGLPPVQVLIIPRLIAAVVSMPLLAFYGSMMAVVGGGLLCWIELDMPPIVYAQRIREVVPMTDVWIGLIKAPVFGLVIAITGCFQGMQVTGNAEEVGLKTTAAVVQSIFMVIVLDAFFAVFFSALGWT